MSKQILLGVAAMLLIAGPVSGLTMTPIAEDRNAGARVTVGGISDFKSDMPDPMFSPLTSRLSAEVMNLGVTGRAWADHDSTIGPLSISGVGYTRAEVIYDYLAGALVQGDSIQVAGIDGAFDVSATCDMTTSFEIDEAAEFSLRGFLEAGFDLVSANGFGRASSQIQFYLMNRDTSQAVFKANVNGEDQGGILVVDETGVIDAGKYDFIVYAYSRVEGGVPNGTGLVGDADMPGEVGYNVYALYDAVSLQLRPLEEPIPEPLTIGLIALGLGTLMFQTSRRRRT